MNAPVEASAWQTLIDRLVVVEATDLSGLPGEEADSLIDEAGDLTIQLMEMPAPHAAAVRWKLDWVVDGKRGNDAYEAAYLTEMIADYRALLTQTTMSQAMIRRWSSSRRWVSLSITPTRIGRSSTCLWCASRPCSCAMTT